MNNAIEKLVEKVEEYVKAGKFTGESIDLVYSILVLCNKYISVEEFSGKCMDKTINIHFIPTSEGCKQYGKNKVVYVRENQMVRSNHDIYHASKHYTPTYGTIRFESGSDDNIEHLEISVSDIYRIDGI